MSRKGITVLLLSVALISAVLYLLLRAPDEPAYKGRKLTEWMQDLRKRDRTQVANAEDAVRRIGRDGVPFLVGVIEQQRSLFWRSRLWLEQRGLLKKGKEVDYQRGKRKSDALRTLTVLGPDAEDAIPVLLAELSTANVEAGLVLVSIGPRAVPHLVILMNGADSDKRRAAAYVLGQMRDVPGVQPVLIEGLKHPDPVVRLPCVVGLSLSSNVERSILFRELEPLLNDSSAMVRSEASRVLSLMNSNNAGGRK